jgi:hypothetical protein
MAEFDRHKSIILGDQILAKAFQRKPECKLMKLVDRIGLQHPKLFEDDHQKSGARTNAFLWKPF